MAYNSIVLPGAGNQYVLELTVTENNTSKLHNLSVLWYSLVVRKAQPQNSGYWSNERCYYTIKIGGNPAIDGYIDGYDFTQYNSLTLASGYVNQTHDSAGWYLAKNWAQFTPAAPSAIQGGTVYVDLQLTSFNRVATLNSVTPSPHTLGTDYYLNWTHNALDLSHTLSVMTSGKTVLESYYDYRTGGESKLKESPALIMKILNTVGGSGTLLYRVATNYPNGVLGTSDKPGTFNIPNISQSISKTSIFVTESVTIDISGMDVFDGVTYMTRAMIGNEEIDRVNTTAKRRVFDFTKEPLRSKVLAGITDAAEYASVSFITEMRNKNNTVTKTANQVSTEVWLPRPTIVVEPWSTLNNYGGIVSTSGVTTSNGVLERKINDNAWGKVADTFENGFKFTMNSANNTSTHTMQVRFKQVGTNRWVYSSVVNWTYKQPVRSILSNPIRVPAGIPVLHTAPGTDVTNFVEVLDPNGKVINSKTFAPKEDVNFTTIVTQKYLDELQLDDGTSILTPDQRAMTFPDWSTYMKSNFKTGGAPARAMGEHYKRNLLLDAKEWGTKSIAAWDFKSHSQAETITTYPERFKGNAVIRVRGDWARRWQYIKNIRTGDVFTVSFWAKSLNDVSLMSTYHESGNPTPAWKVLARNFEETKLVPKEWTFYYYTIEVTDARGALRLPTRPEPFAQDYAKNDPDVLMSTPMIYRGAYDPLAEWDEAFEDMPASEKPLIWISGDSEGSQLALVTSMTNYADYVGKVTRHSKIKNLASRQLIFDGNHSFAANSAVYIPPNGLLQEKITYDGDGTKGAFQLKFSTQVAATHVDFVVEELSLFLGDGPSLKFTLRNTGRDGSESVVVPNVGEFYVDVGHGLMVYKDGWLKANAYVYKHDYYRKQSQLGFRTDFMDPARINLVLIRGELPPVHDIPRDAPMSSYFKQTDSKRNFVMPFVNGYYTMETLSALPPILKWTMYTYDSKGIRSTSTLSGTTIATLLNHFTNSRLDTFYLLSFEFKDEQVLNKLVYSLKSITREQMPLWFNSSPDDFYFDNNLISSDEVLVTHIPIRSTFNYKEIYRSQKLYTVFRDNEVKRFTDYKFSLDLYNIQKTLTHDYEKLGLTSTLYVQLWTDITKKIVVAIKPGQKGTLSGIMNVGSSGRVYLEYWHEEASGELVLGLDDFVLASMTGEFKKATPFVYRGGKWNEIKG